jgi:hypothetical protein
MVTAWFIDIPDALKQMLFFATPMPEVLGAAQSASGACIFPGDEGYLGLSRHWKDPGKRLAKRTETNESSPSVPSMYETQDAPHLAIAIYDWE